MCNDISLYPDGLYSTFILQQSQGINKHLGHIEYNSANDRIKVRFNYTDMPFCEKLKMVLDKLDIPESILSEYRKQIIDQSGVKDKKLEIEDMCRHVDLSIVDSQDKIILKRTLK